MEDYTITNIIAPLSQEQRNEADLNARAAVIHKIGKKPQREEFQTRSFGKYPAWVVTLMISLVVLVLATAFIVSAMRLYHIGSEEFQRTINHANSATVAGIAIVLLSEATAVLFTVGLSVLGKTNTGRGIMIAFAAASTLLALSGNFYVALHDQHITVFSVLEAMLPPIFTIGAAYVLKEIIFQQIEQRFHDQLEFENALAVYQQRTANPHDHADFLQMYANALWDKIMENNRDHRRKHEGKPIPKLLAGLPRAEKLLLIQREMNADNWFVPAEKEGTQVVTARAQGVAQGVGFLAQAQPVHNQQ